jgi:hypothetical protein
MNYSNTYMIEHTMTECATTCEWSDSQRTRKKSRGLKRIENLFIYIVGVVTKFLLNLSVANYDGSGILSLPYHGHHSIIASSELGFARSDQKKTQDLTKKRLLNPLRTINRQSYFHDCCFPRPLNY